MATKKKTTDEVKVQNYRTSLRVDLGPPDVAKSADRAAHLMAERDMKTEELREHNKHAKAIIGQMDAEIRRLSNEVRDKCSYRDVECERRYNYTKGVVQEVRTDTGEVLSERPMSDAERQRELGFGGGSLEEEFSG